MNIIDECEDRDPCCLGNCASQCSRWLEPQAFGQRSRGQEPQACGHKRTQHHVVLSQLWPIAVGVCGNGGNKCAKDERQQSKKKSRKPRLTRKPLGIWMAQPLGKNNDGGGQSSSE